MIDYLNTKPEFRDYDGEFEEMHICGREYTKKVRVDMMNELTPIRMKLKTEPPSNGETKYY